MEYSLLDAGRIRQVSRVRANVSAGSWEKTGESATEKEKESKKKRGKENERESRNVDSFSLSVCLQRRVYASALSACDGVCT